MTKEIIICLKCGKPAESMSFYKKWGRDKQGNAIKAKMFVHKSHITPVVPMRMIDEECTVLETDPEWD